MASRLKSAEVPVRGKPVRYIGRRIARSLMAGCFWHVAWMKRRLVKSSRIRRRVTLRPAGLRRAVAVVRLEKHAEALRESRRRRNR